MAALFVSLKICFYSCFYRIAFIGSSHDSLTTRQHPTAPVQENVIDIFNLFSPPVVDGRTRYSV